MVGNTSTVTINNNYIHIKTVNEKISILDVNNMNNSNSASSVAQPQDVCPPIRDWLIIWSNRKLIHKLQNELVGNEIIIKLGKNGILNVNEEVKANQIVNT